MIPSNDPKHRPEHRKVVPAPRPSPPPGSPAPSGFERTDRRKYLVPDAHLPTVLDACRRGVSEVRIARALGVNYRTWMRVRSEDERVAGALAESRKLEEDELVSLLMDKARGGETTAIIFALKGRHGYRDQGAPPNSAEAKVNVTIHLPAAQATLEDYSRALEGEIVR